MLDATVGGESANSYATVAEADAYFDARLHSSAWQGLSSQDKERVLIFATSVAEASVSALWDQAQLPNDATMRILSDLKSDSECTVVWTGSPATSDQALAWPRIGMKNQNGFTIPEDVIPQRLKVWQFELALKLIAEDRTEENAAAIQGLTKLKAGPVELGWKPEAGNAPLIPVSVMQFLVRSWWFAFQLDYNTRAKMVVL